MNEELHKNICKNCKHFYAHYVKNTSSYLVTVGRGHCGLTNKYLQGEHAACKRWEAGEEKTDVRTQNVKKTLLKMAKRIEDIALILNDD